MFRPIACASRRSSIPCQLNGQTDWHARAHRADMDLALELSRYPRSSCANVESTAKIGRILRQHKMAHPVRPIIYLSQQGMDWWCLGQLGEIIFRAKEISMGQRQHHCSVLSIYMADKWVSLALAAVLVNYIESFICCRYDSLGSGSRSLEIAHRLFNLFPILLCGPWRIMVSIGCDLRVLACGSITTDGH